jgi:hypothetical protein
MALVPLATVADLEARGVTVAGSETAVVSTYLDVASALVREAAGTPITQTTSTVVLEGDHDQRLRLPGNPVQSVTSVTVDGDDVTDYKLASGALWRRMGWRAVKWSSYGWRADMEPSAVEVTYVHGLPTVPADIIDMVCRLAGQALVQFRAGDPTARMVDMERIGDYQVKYSGVETGIMLLSHEQRARLAARFGAGPGVVVKSR